MRIGVAYPDQPRWPKYAWVADSLRNLGHSVEWIQSFDQLRTADPECDLIIFAQYQPINAADLRKLAESKRSIWVQWWFDIVQPEPFMAAFDCVFIKERSRLTELAALGIKARYLDQGCPSWFGFCEHPETPKYDFAIVGRRQDKYSQRRNAVLALANEGFRVAWIGPGTHVRHSNVTCLPRIKPEDIPQALSEAAVALCVDLRHDLDGYTSDRFWLYCGAGAAVLRRRTPGITGDFFVDYSTGPELLEAAKGLIEDRSLRQYLGRRARVETMARHTIEHRCQELIMEAMQWQKRVA